MRYEDLVLQDGPLGLWPLDEGVGTVARVVGAASAGTYAGSGHGFRVVGPSPHVPHGVSLDGAASYISFDVSSFLLGTGQPQAFEAWLYFDTTITSASAQKIVWGSTAAADCPMDFGQSTGAFAGEVISVLNNSAGAGDVTGFDTFAISAGWHHHVVTYDGTQNGWNWYMDGHDAFNVNGRLSTSGGSFGFSGSQTWTIGRNSASTYTAVAGVAMVAVYKRHLSQGRARDHFLAGSRGLFVPDRARLR